MVLLESEQVKPERAGWGMDVVWDLAGGLCLLLRKGRGLYGARIWVCLTGPGLCSSSWRSWPDSSRSAGCRAACSSPWRSVSSCRRGKARRNLGGRATPRPGCPVSGTEGGVCRASPPSPTFLPYWAHSGPGGWNIRDCGACDPQHLATQAGSGYGVPQLGLFFFGGGGVRDPKSPPPLDLICFVITVFPSWK